MGVSGILSGGGAEITGDYSTTNTTSTTQSVSQTQQDEIKATGNQDGINHDQDTFILLLNPSVSVYSGQAFKPTGTASCIPAIQWRAGMDGPTAMLYKLTVQDLKNFSGLPANVSAVMAAHRITGADFATILALDPFASGSAAIDEQRYVRTTHNFPYEPPDTSQECNNSGVCSCMVMSSTNVHNDLSTTATATKTSYGVGLKESVTVGQKNLLSATVTATQKFTWTASSSQSNTTSSTKSANVTIPCPSVNWKEAGDYTQIDIYWDTLFGSFMFAPTVVTEPQPGLNTFLNGRVVDHSGNVLRHVPVSVSVGRFVRQTFTNSKGEYKVLGIPRKEAAEGRAKVTVSSQTSDVQVGSTQPVITRLK